MEKEINGIVLNRMYSGEYLRENLGHEVINLYQADNGNHYLYLLDYGTFDRKYKEKINYMLMIRYIDTAKYKIIGLACGLTDTLNESDELIFENQEHFHSNSKESVCYGGVNVFDIFKLNQSYQDVCITYKAEELFIPKKDYKLFIRYNSTCKIDKGDYYTIFNIKSYNEALSSQKQYVMPSREDAVKQKDYEILLKLIDTDNNDFWEKCENKVPKYIPKSKEKAMHKEFINKIIYLSK